MFIWKVSDLEGEVRLKGLEGFDGRFRVPVRTETKKLEGRKTDHTVEGKVGQTSSSNGKGWRDFGRTRQRHTL